MAIMTRDQILAAEDIGYENIDLSDVPGWGIVRIRDLSAADRDRLEASLLAPQRNGQKSAANQQLNLKNVRARFCAFCIVGEDMQPLFSEADIEALGRKSAKALDRIFDRIRARNGLTEDAVNELVENFNNGQTGDSHIA
jgi:hypothetical protein